MTFGPCFCGDPFCGNCGAPDAAALEAFFDSLSARFGKQIRRVHIEGNVDNAFDTACDVARWAFNEGRKAEARDAAEEKALAEWERSQQPPEAVSSETT
ncbi:MAG: hypothetical protein ACE5FM_05940 [Methyloligellaceae bacterium]